MKRIIITVLLLVFTASVFTACNNAVKTEEKTTDSNTVISTLPDTTLAQDAEETATTQLTTVVAETTTQIHAETTTRTPATSTTRIPSTVATTASGRIYREEKVEEEVKYGVRVHLYKTIRYQIVDGERVDISSEYTDVTLNRTFYSADYDELLPAARQNRDTYRDYINEVLRIINGYRAEEGIAPLTLSEDLTVMSCVRAEEIAWSGNHEHTRPGFKSFKTLFREAGYEEGLAGENLGWGFSSPEAVCEAWKASKLHYENIMNPEFTQIGIGVAADPDPDGKLCWTQHFYEG